MKTQTDKISTKYYVIKVSNPGYDVLNPEKERKINASKEDLPHMFSALAMPYLLGAKNQIIRYQGAALNLKTRSIPATQQCIHESSTLFEDLNIIGRYLEKCKKKNKLHKLWLDIRNHIRHDIREELNNENDDRKNLRAKRLNLNPAFQMDMGFAVDSIKIGGTIIEIKTITDYLNWAEEVIRRILEEAKQKGYYRVEEKGSTH